MRAAFKCLELLLGVMAGTARLGTWCPLCQVFPVPGIPCARHWDTQGKTFLGAGEDRKGEKTPGISKDEKGAPDLSWTKLLMKIP